MRWEVLWVQWLEELCKLSSTDWMIPLKRLIRVSLPELVRPNEVEPLEIFTTLIMSHLDYCSVSMPNFNRLDIDGVASLLSCQALLSDSDCIQSKQCNLANHNNSQISVCLMHHQFCSPEQLHKHIIHNASEQLPQHTHRPKLRKAWMQKKHSSGSAKTLLQRLASGWRQVRGLNGGGRASLSLELPSPLQKIPPVHPLPAAILPSHLLLNNNGRALAWLL